MNKSVEYWFMDFLHHLGLISDRDWMHWTMEGINPRGLK